MKQLKGSIPEEHVGDRLDRALEIIFPDRGLRYRRRLCDENAVLVDGVARKPSYKVKASQEIVVEVKTPVRTVPGGVSVIARSDVLAAVSKPGGMPSANIGGRKVMSVESMLPAIFPHDDPILLNRLDTPTSGLLIVALGAAGQSVFVDLEQAGQVEKFYYAIVMGALEDGMRIRSRLDTDNRKTTRVMNELNPEPDRWTEVIPVKSLGEDRTLVRAEIKRGARHQIRAHLASVGHPIWGDEQYGGGAAVELHLHHYRFRAGHFVAEALPVWWQKYGLREGDEQDRMG